MLHVFVTSCHSVEFRGLIVPLKYCLIEYNDVFQNILSFQALYGKRYAFKSRTLVSWTMGGVLSPHPFVL
jgi:hypothetical protein